MIIGRQLLEKTIAWNEKLWIFMPKCPNGCKNGWIELALEILSESLIGENQTRKNGTNTGMLSNEEINRPKLCQLD